MANPPSAERLLVVCPSAPVTLGRGFGYRATGKAVRFRFVRRPDDPGLPTAAVTPVSIQNRVARDVAEQGWAVCPDFLDAAAVAALRDEALAGFAEGAFRQARVGIGPSRRLMTEVRSDQVLWLDAAALTPAQQTLWDSVERLRLELNAATMLGLFEFEAHLAIYPPAAFYRRHLDRFHETRHRVVSCIVYLNDAWTEADGGQLRIELDDTGRSMDVVPCGGTLVAFLSERFWHEVLPARRQRLSVTGWLRLRE